MRITNRGNLYAPLVDAIKNDDYDAGHGDISCTALISPPQKVELERRHADELTVDAADMVYALLGQVIHSIIERAGGDGYRTEERLYADVLGWTLSGKFDLYFHDPEFGYILSDFKLTSVWEIINGPKDERAQQLNVLAWLCEQNGMRVDRLEVCALLRDWSRPRAEREPEYPQQQVIRYFIPRWPEEKAVAFIEERVRLHQRARAGDIAPCTPEDRWSDAPKWAVMKRGNKTAYRLLDTPELAETWALAQKKCTVEKDGEVVLRPDIEFVFRPGDQTRRCRMYCAAGMNGVCPQFNALAAEAEPFDDEEAAD